jgi:FkbM family methyltransferase
MLSRMSAMIRRRLADRRQYARARDWFMSLYNRLLMRAAGKWLPGKYRSVAVYLKEIADPFYLRLGSTDWLVLEQIYFQREYDALSQLQLGDVRQIVDLGANVGLSVRLWRQRFPEAAVLAIEPDPDNVRALERNCPRDGKMKVVQACVAASARTVQIDRSAGEWGIRMVDCSPDQHRISVKALSLLEILAETNVTGPIDLLKCDIEGAEAEVFGKCAEWIARVRAMILEIHAPYTLDQWQKDMQAAGARMEVICTIKSDPNAFVILAAVPSLARQTGVVSAGV